MPSDEMVERAMKAFRARSIALANDPTLHVEEDFKIAMRAAILAALAAAEAGEQPVYRYQTPDHRSFSQTAPPMPWQGDYTPVTIRAGTAASPPSEASRDERAAIRIWAFHKAPGELRELSPHGGDEDWIAVVPKLDEYGYVPFLEDCDRWFGCCSISHHEHPNYPDCTVCIGAHA